MVARASGTSVTLCREPTLLQQLDPAPALHCIAPLQLYFGALHLKTLQHCTAVGLWLALQQLYLRIVLQSY